MQAVDYRSCGGVSSNEKEVKFATNGNVYVILKGNRARHFDGRWGFFDVIKNHLQLQEYDTE